MKTLSPDALLAALNWRYATKKFDAAKKIPGDVWAALEQSMVLAPSSFGLQPWKFLVITDAAVKAKLTPISWNQTQAVESSHFVVFTVRKGLDAAYVEHYFDRVSEVSGAPKSAFDGYKKMMLGSVEQARAAGTIDVWQTNQVYIALGQFMASAALLGVDACPMEGIDREKYDEVLGLKGTEFATVVACAAGYRASDDKHASDKKVRFKASEVVAHI